MKNAFIFDIDGTLIDSNAAHAESWKTAFERYGKKVDLQEMLSLIGMGGDKILEKYLSDKENRTFGSELEEYRAKLFSENYLPKIKPFPMVRELFQKILDEGKQIALATSANEDDILEYKKIANIDDLVNNETSADDVEESKPDPAIFEAAFDKLSAVEKSEVLIIGDTIYDAQAAVQSDIAIVGVTSGGWSAEKLRSEGCVNVFKNVADIYNQYQDVVKFSYLKPSRQSI